MSVAIWMIALLWPPRVRGHWNTDTDTELVFYVHKDSSDKETSTMKVVLILSLGFILHVDADGAHHHTGHHVHHVEAAESDDDVQQGEWSLQNDKYKSNQSISVERTKFSLISIWCRNVYKAEKIIPPIKIKSNKTCQNILDLVFWLSKKYIILLSYIVRNLLKTA